MNIKKYLVVGGVVVTMVAGVATFVLAEDMNKTDRPENMGQKIMKVGGEITRMMAEHKEQPIVLQVSENGKALLRGTIDVVGTSTLTVKSWGGSWMVNISSNTKLAPGSDMTQFKAGDLVGVQGTVSQGAAWTIDADMVRDWTTKKTEQTTQSQIKDLMNSVTPRNWEGVASNVSVSGLTLTVDNTAYVVTLAASAKVVNQQFVTMNLSDVKNGDKVRIYAIVSGTNATAYVLRDVSVGANPNMGSQGDNH